MRDKIVKAERYIVYVLILAALGSSMLMTWHPCAGGSLLLICFIAWVLLLNVWESAPYPGEKDETTNHPEL